MKNIARHRIIYIPEFGSGEGGGNQRSAQLGADIAKTFGSVENLNISYRKTIAEWLYSLLFLPLVLYRLRAYKLTVKGWLRACLLYKILRRFLAQKEDSVFFIEGFHGVFLVLGILIRESSARYITFPQNIEFMVSGSQDRHFRSLEARFNAEVSLYQGALQNIAISEFDRAIIESFSAKASLHPFYPTEEKREFLKKIKTARSHVHKDEILIFGAVSNKPFLRMPIESFLREASDRKLGKFRISVAGFETEVFREFASFKITILGTLPTNKLSEVLARVGCVLAPVSQTTGFLTRLVDMNLAGIPVVMYGHYIQAHNLEDHGIYITKDIEDLLNTMAQTEPPRKEFVIPQLIDALGENWADA